MKKLFLCILLMTLMMTILFVNSYSSEKLIKEINKAIAEKGAKWTASENWVTQLAPEERKKLYGSFLNPPDATPENMITIPIVTDLPPALDWRDNNGNWVTPVKNQGGCGSCWDFSAVGQVESWWKIHNNNPDSMINLSEQFVLSCSDGDCDGWWPGNALEFIRTEGIPTEDCFGYLANDRIPCSNVCSNWEKEALKIPGWGYITLGEANVQTIKSALSLHPVSGSYTVFEDFNYYSGGVYEHVWGEEQAGHAILIVGWNDELECWICKNSWGPNWGENGYFRIKWGSCGMGERVPFIWNDMTGGNALIATPDKLDVSMAAGESMTENITIQNKGSDILEFIPTDFGIPVVFHPDNYFSYDGLSWWCGDPETGGYQNHWLQYLDTPELDLSNTSNPNLTWMGRWEIEDPATAESPYDGWDGCNVWISTNGAQSFEVAQPVSPAYTCQSLFSFGDPDQGWNMGPGIAGWAGSSDGWIPIEFDLSSYKYENVIIRFAFASDPGFCTLNDPNVNGFFVDEIKVADGTTTIYENHGDNDGEVTLFGDGVQAASWLKVNSDTYSLMPSESATLDVEITSKNMVAGYYYGFIRIVSNDSTQNNIEIPCTLHLYSPEHDLAVNNVILPQTTPRLLTYFQPQAQIKNLGSNTENNFKVVCNIQKNETILYSDTLLISELAVNATQLCEFKQFFILDAGELDLQIKVIPNSNDTNSENNTTTSKLTITNLIDNFDEGSDLWFFTGGWGVTDVFSGRSGDYTIHVNGGITPYKNNMDTYVMFKSGFDLSLVDNASIKFWTKYYTEENADICYVESSEDAGTWTILDSFSGSNLAWNQREVFLPDNDMPVWIRFRFSTDNANTSFGVLIDDVEFYHTTTDVETANYDNNTPLEYNLDQNYPNPFNMDTQINYNIEKPGDVSLVIYNVKGEVVRNLLKKYQATGNYTINWNGCDNSGNNVGTGIYFYNLKVNGRYSKTNKMILMK